MHYYALNLYFLVSIISHLSPTESAKILGIFPFHSKSHHSINQPIVKGLATKGHEVTIICHFKSIENVSNYREILISESEGLKNFIDGITIEDSLNYAGVKNLLDAFYDLESTSCNRILRLEYIRQLITSKVNPIDLIIAEVYHVQCFHLLAHKLNVPLIIVLPPSSDMGVDYFLGNPFVPSITPLRDTRFTTKMNFLQRFENIFQYALSYWSHNFIHNKDMKRYAQEILNIELPSDEELNRRTALAFYNNHPSFISRPKSPNVIDIAGIHIKEPETLPQDIANFIEEAPQGVIYFSFGATMNASSMTPERLKEITDAFSAIPQRVLWRINDLNIVGIPPNVKLGKWFPQRDILEHKNVIAFISHCGLFGTLEAIHTSTPIIGIPFILDQFQNANILVERGVGIYIDYFSMNKNTLLDAIKEITSNIKYRENIMKWSKVFKDRPLSSLDEALYWTEYVLKHQGAPHLRPVAADMPLYQYLLLDVLALTLLIGIGFMYFLKRFFKCIIFFACCRKPKKNKRSDQLKMHLNFSIIFPLVMISIGIQLKPTSCAKIFGIFPTRSKSHHSINQPIVKGLAIKGHEVTIISHFKSNDNLPNYTEILLPKPLTDWVDTVAIQNIGVGDFVGIWNYIELVRMMEKSSCDDVLGSEYVRRLINSNEKTIDLILVEVYHSQCYHLLAYKLNVPLIIISPPTMLFGVDYFIGNPFYPSYLPFFMYTTNMNFFQRVENVFYYAVLYWYQSYVFNKDMDIYAREVFKMKLPFDEELNRRTALALYNNHFSFISRPKSPNAIDIAGIHIKEPKELPKDIEDFIEGSTHGVIFFSFGTTVKASSMSPEKLKIITDAFSVIPQRVIWRVNELNVTYVPPNVKLGKWFPQRDILEHKNVIAFISHCGLFGTLEAIHTATPVIGIPFIYDQFINAKILVEKGAGIYVDYFAMDNNTFIDALREVVQNPKYSENMKKLSKIFKDRPIYPLDEALYWTEYVLKHQGAPHLRTAAADMPFYQYLLLDILTLMLVIVVGFLYFLKYSFKFIISLVCCRRKGKKNKIQ
ncbi:uncharacterized protein LOC135834418 [Planococcus citri]|uniref:uncharacterized protein LOC135834418 n=1 Tax=Planococcus citri TaxID=170843 RepID=UPI0031F8B24F